MSDPDNRNRSIEIESPFLSNELFASEDSVGRSPVSSSVLNESPFLLSLEPGASDAEALDEGYGWEHETAEGLRKRLKYLPRLPHFVEWVHKDMPLMPLNPGIYDGPGKYKLAVKSPLQECLNAVMKKKEFSHIKVALVDLTKSDSQPEFAGVHHTDQVFVASIPKLAAMLAAFQLRHDLRVALKKKGVDTLTTLYEQVRDDWASTQNNPGKLVRAGGTKVPLKAPNAPELERIFTKVPAGDQVAIEFSSTGEDATRLEEMADAFRDGKADSRQNLDALGFAERLRLMTGDKTRASDYVTSTVVHDLGYAYIASTLLQSGLYDPKRGGGLWLGADYAGGKWRGPLAGGDPRSANAGSLAAFLTLLVQGSLVDPQSSADMLALIKNEATITPNRIGFRQGLEQLPDEGSIVSVHSRGGVDKEGMDECAVIERQVEKDKDSVRYIAVGLRAKRVAEVKALILELDKCILANNRPAAVQEWLADQELEYSYDEQEQFYEDSERDDGALDEETEPEFFSESQFLSEDELGIIGGRDDRAPVADTQAAPFRWICSVAVQRRIKTAATERKTGLAPAGTGFLISPRHVLTAAHLLRSVKKDDQGGITERHEALLVAVKPGRDGDAAPFGAIEAKSWTPHPKWNPEGNTPQYDYAVITLNEAVGDRTFKNLKDESLCFWGSPKCGANTLLDNLPSAVARGLVGMRVVTAGYPDEAKGQMWCAAGTVSAGSPELDSLLNRGGRVEDWAKRARTISVTTDASEGQSGSPVWVVNNGKRYLVGILVSIAKHYNQVVNLNSDVVRQIQSWIANAAIGAKKQNLLDEPDVRSSETGEFESTEDAPDRLEVADAAHNCPTCATHYHEHELYESEESAETEERAGLESDEEAFDWLMDGSSEEELESEEEESVEVEWDTQKGESKKSSLHKVPTSNIFMHVYFNNLATTFSAQQFFDWVVGQSPDAMGPNRFQNEGVEIHLVNNSATAVSDLKGTLKTAGSVVVYFGHTVLGPKTTLGLAPSDPPAKKPGITCADLTKLLNTAKAKIVVLAGCATSQCVTKIKGDTVVIVTQSGPNRVTNTLQWAPAIKTLLDELLAAATVGDALDAANKIFAKHSSTDSFKRINGDPTLRMIQPAAEP